MDGICPIALRPPDQRRMGGFNNKMRHMTLPAYGYRVKSMQNKTLIVGQPTASVQDNQYRLSATLKAQGGEAMPEHQREIWLSLPVEYAEVFVNPESSDCFLMGLLYFAMRMGYSLKIEGKISAQLLWNLSNEAMPLISAYRPLVQPVNIEAAETTDFPGGHFVGTGFSAGVDSFSTIIGNLRHHVRPEDKLTHLFFFNVGANGQGRSLEEVEHVRKKFRMRYESFAPAAQLTGLPFIPIDSNVPSFMPNTFAAQLTLCNASAIYFLRKGLSKYLLSSEGYNCREWFRYLQLQPEEQRFDMALLEPVLCQWLGDRNLQIIPYGNSMTRLEKTSLLADYEPARQCLNVCNSEKAMEINCSVCTKCRRTMLDLELLNKLDHFRKVFDVDLFRQKFKSRDYAEILYPPPERENFFLHSSRRYAREQGIDIASQCTQSDRFFAFMHQTWVYRVLKELHLLDFAKRLVGRG
ncbi:MAG: hypothetical protein GX945_07995 [Lentisphaerae bacterium]|jgi:hypothetical protein|nr:hypothetical protein [Lentisphaerota bacterium]